MKNFCLYIFIAIALSLVSCKPKVQKTMPSPKIPVTTVIEKDIPVNMTFVGQTFGSSDIKIQPRATGFIQGVYFKEGDDVKKGQLLYKIDPSSLKAQLAESKANLENAISSLSNAQMNYDRIAPLAEISAVSQSQYDSAISQLSSAAAIVAAKQASFDYAAIQLGYTTIYAPISGIIGETKGKTGDYVGPGTQVTELNTISQIDSILVQFYMPYTDYNKYINLKNGKFTDIRLYTSDGKLYDLPGTFNFAGRAINPSAGSIMIQVSFENPDSLLRPGEFSKVTTTIGTYNNALVIPQTSTIENQGVHMVYVVGKDNRISQKIIEVSQSYNNLWIVTSGLNSGDVIVTNGFHKLSPGMEIIPVNLP